MCKHRWIIAKTMSRARCAWCGLQVERVEPDQDGTWLPWRTARKLMLA